MQRERIYLDYAATTPVRPEVRASMEKFLTDGFGNPSSLHREGREAREALERARESMRRGLGASDYRLVFTGSGTEADNAALVGAVLKSSVTSPVGAARGRKAHIVASAVEHSAIHGALEFASSLGVTHTLVEVDRDGRVDPQRILGALRPETALVSVMAVNNEVGTVEPIDELGLELRRRGIVFHTDAIQHLGKLPLDLSSLAVDLVSLSAHKIYGPKGVGALLVRKDVAFSGFVRGGPQEDNLRAGTESVAGAVGFAAALERALQELTAEGDRLRRLQRQLRDGIAERFDGYCFNTPLRLGAPHILNVSFERVEGEALLALLDLLGVAISTGSACNVGRKRTSRVLKAMGRDAETIRNTVRFSLGKWTTREAVDEALDRLEEAVHQLRSVAPRSTPPAGHG